MDGANQVAVGIDVAKATLDLHFLPSGQLITYTTPRGHLTPQAFAPSVLSPRLEATGG